jgi:hypothetical protein
MVSRNKPAGEVCDLQAVPEPAGNWDYELDDHGVTYGRGPWPFFRRGTEQTSQPTLIRLAPNTAYRAWGIQYVLLMPNEALTRVYVCGQTYVKRPRFGTCERPLYAELSLPNLNWRWLSPIDAEILERARQRRRKILRFLRRARAERDRGQLAPITAHERWAATQHRPTSTKTTT